jgi:hypothetical protein
MQRLFIPGDRKALLSQEKLLHLLRGLQQVLEK